MWYHFIDNRLSTKKTPLLPDTSNHNILFSFYFVTLNKCVSISSCTGSFHSSNDPGWTFQFGSWSFDHEWLELLTTRPERSLKCLNVSIRTHPSGALCWIRVSFFPWPRPTDGSIHILCRKSAQSMHPDPLSPWLLPAASLWKRRLNSQVPRPRVCIIDSLLLWSPSLSSSFFYNAK